MQCSVYTVVEVRKPRTAIHCISTEFEFLNKNIYKKKKNVIRMD